MPANGSDFDEFSQEFAFKIALGVDPPSEVCKKFSVSPQRFGDLMKNKAFVACVDRHTHYIQENGISPKLKAYLRADEIMDVFAEIAANSENSPEDRMKAADKVLAHAGLDNPETMKEALDSPNLPIFGIQIITHHAIGPKDVEKTDDPALPSLPTVIEHDALEAN